MSLAKFLQTIDNSFVGRFIDKEVSVLNAINPDIFFVENIRRFYNMPVGIARFFCEMATKQNLFKKKYAVQCPNCTRIVDSFENEDDIPATINCTLCEIDECEKHEFSKNECNVLEFYKLNREK